LLRGFYFSTPYYYKNRADGDDVDVYAMATREDDVLFTSFVNCVVMATIYAQENHIQKENSEEMPLVSLFGDNLSWALKNAISYSGSYDQIYMKHFGNVNTPRAAKDNADYKGNDEGGSTQASRGRNTLNEGGPLIFSLPFQ